MKRSRLANSCVLLFLFCSFNATADTVPSLFNSWFGSVDYFMTGTTLATDTGADGRVDSVSQPASFNVTSNDIKPGASLESAYLYWAGTQTQPAGPLSGTPDSMVTLTTPGGSASAITADSCFGSDGSSSSYDMFMCRTDVTSVVSGGSMTGTYTVDDYSGLVNDGTADNASAALLLVYTGASIGQGSVTIYDGLLTMSNNNQLLTLTGFDVPTAPAVASLTYYALEGDTGGSGTEQVVVSGSPGGASIILSDASNPAGDPFNRTINTQTPSLTGVIGVDIDRFDISAALTPGDNSLNVEYFAGTDKYWLGVNVVGVSAVPIPASVWLFGTALAGLVWFNRRREKAQLQ